VALSRELALVRDFLAIEQVRFGERLRFEAEATPEAQACLVPPMLLQPLVENAVKHGIGQLIEPVLIRIRAVRAGSLLRITVENDVDPDAPAARGTGSAWRTCAGAWPRPTASTPAPTGAGKTIYSGSSWRCRRRLGADRRHEACA
jgi:two-component system sensor histidine kinase AlgZ